MVQHDQTSIKMERRGDLCIVNLQGRIAEHDAGVLGEKLRAAIEGGARDIVVNLSEVPMITSAGLGAFMVAHKGCRAKGGSVRLAGAQPLVRQVLETTKLTKLFGVYATVADALAAANEDVAEERP